MNQFFYNSAIGRTQLSLGLKKHIYFSWWDANKSIDYLHNIELFKANLDQEKREYTVRSSFNELALNSESNFRRFSSISIGSHMVYLNDKNFIIVDLRKNLVVRS